MTNVLIHVIERSPQNTNDQHCYSMSCLFVLIYHHFKPLTEIKTNEVQIEAEAANKLRAMGSPQYLLVVI